MRLSRIIRSDIEGTPEETISRRRVMFWVAVWVVLLVGIALYFKYARFLTPLLA